MKKSGKGKGRSDRTENRTTKADVVFIDDLSAASLRRVSDLVRSGYQVEVVSPSPPRLKAVEEHLDQQRKTPTIRLSKKSKLEMAIRIKTAAVAMVRDQGVFATVSGGKLLSLDIPPNSIAHITPFSGLPGLRAPYGLDIWHKRLKVFSVWWEPFEIVAFRYGEWMNDFVPGSFARSSDPVPSSLRDSKRPMFQIDATVIDIRSPRPAMPGRSVPPENKEDHHDGD